ncbi:cyclic nucleotide-binding domain-containing protein [Phreatobacter aquaticus]|uniref:Cyclic nucleotide-binding domain-containing protein n=1 Tax=Phreatobacter aquaticus TaxID=2570229 RepID=A0A4D7QKC3_9HYPH|nr:cyclic nucleotide-binding domain-containing protein [Phreatobacter aquaticus]QCK88058.1 cyclic nucleotide-binding domain-containing protein [Phreatobacter aquaticus]
MADEAADFSQMVRGLGVVMRYRSGDVLFREGETPTYMYFVLSGEVEMSSRGKFIEKIDSGRAMGAISMIDQNPRSATATALVDTEVALIDQKKFRFMVEEVPNFVWYVMGLLVKRLRATNDAL